MCPSITVRVLRVTDVGEFDEDLLGAVSDRGAMIGSMLSTVTGGRSSRNGPTEASTSLPISVAAFELKVVEEALPWTVLIRALLVPSGNPRLTSA
jgi:hypothetical protein